MIKDNNNCTGCAACMNACPHNAIKIEYDRTEGFLYPEISSDNCVDCGICVKVCDRAVSLKRNIPIESYTAHHIKYKEYPYSLSSSGAIFPALASTVIERGGVVYGARYSDSFDRVFHDKATTASELVRFQGSKYVQSEIGNIYREVGSDLKGGLTVLFSGTPCQVAGLRAYLGKEYDNLYTVDVVCHGVGQKDILFDNINELSGNKKTIGVNLRSKSLGYMNHSMAVSLDDNDIVTAKWIESPFCSGFVNNLILRPSCGQCVFATPDRTSDITLMDNWDFCRGDEKQYGSSIVLINTSRGQELYRSCSSLIVLSPIEFSLVKKRVYNLNRPTVFHYQRKKVFRRYKKGGYKKIRRMMFSPMQARFSLKYKIKRTKKRVLRRLKILFHK